MKKFISSTIFAVLAISLITGCYKMKQEKRKPRNNSTECKYNVTALSPTSSIGHFAYSDNSGNYVLIAKNYGDYQSKIVPGEEYMIGFYETDCGPMVCMGDMSKRIAGNGETMRCIVITCLTPKKKENNEGGNGNGCLSCTDDKTLKDDPSMGTGISKVSGNTLTASMHIRSYNPDADLSNMVLYYDADGIGKSMAPIQDIPVRIVLKNADPSVNPQYERRKCFDLTELKNAIHRANNSIKTATLNILQSDQSTIEKVTWNIQ